MLLTAEIQWRRRNVPPKLPTADDDDDDDVLLTDDDDDVLLLRNWSVRRTMKMRAMTLIATQSMAAASDVVR